MGSVVPGSVGSVVPGLLGFSGFSGLGPTGVGRGFSPVFPVFSTVTVSAVPVSLAPGMVYLPLALVRISLPSLTV